MVNDDRRPVLRRRARWLAFVAVVAVVVVAVVLLWPGDRDRLHGAWAGNGVRLTFEANQVVLTGDGYPGPQRSYYRLEPGASPKRIVIWSAEGPNINPPRQVFGFAVGPPSPPGPEFECHGIYELDGDRLRISMPLPGAAFPTDFGPTGGVVFDLRRE
jgi:uncharacterized protein (TIGR03067 family)